MNKEAIPIGDRQIGLERPVFVIAEAGVNHNGDLDLARRLIDVAVEAGADAVKFQSFRAEGVATRSAAKADYQTQTTGAHESQQAMLKRLELSAEAHQELFSYCKVQGILFISTPFDRHSADLLEKLGVPAFKIGSGEITNLPFLEYIAGKGKPIVLSTGMSYLSEVDEAVRSIIAAGNSQICLLHCVSNYPAEPADANLRAMVAMATAFQTPVGYSDHTVGPETALAAVALGASIIEKHFTLDRTMPGPDHRASADPAELRALVSAIRTVEKALGDGIKRPMAAEENTRTVARRSLTAVADISEGERLTQDMVTALRPAAGISPASWKDVVGRRARRAILAGGQLTWGDLE